MGPSQSLLVIALSLSSILTSSTDYSALIFKGCADQTFQNSNAIYTGALRTLLDALISQSSATKFYKTTSGDGTPAAVSGLFQCRGDISNSDCSSCVRKAPSLAQKLCGQAIAARVQLHGCYLRYEISGFRQASGVELLYKLCGSTRASGGGFGDRLDPALGEIVKGVGSGGFYAGAYESVYVMGQCEGDLSSADCVSCAKTAIDKAKSECGGAISAQLYLQACYISYAYYPNGVATNNQHPFSSSGAQRWNAQKIIAVVLGGAVGVGLVMACLLFTKSVFKKRHRNYKYGG
ncbi:plasmodesmata-located protein 2-like [Salvia divinorum]|uniref:Plasmodesmata-located protein 2-like n=1 Tax=Salvia divinorum TaxID=28513 RepID=A0ABD1GU93_SALDI